MDDVQGILHHFNVHLIRLLEMAFDSCIELGQFAKAVSYGTRLLEPYRLGIMHGNHINGLSHP